MTDISESKATRLASIDFLRGLVIVIMALDHVRDYTTNVRFDPLDLEQTDPALFLTRWITHFCAPVFVLLAGVSAGLQGARGKSNGELSKFLLTRGLWLVFLELTVVYFGWAFNFTPSAFLQVIWAIGMSMIALAGLIYLPRAAIAAIAFVMIAGHNLLPGAPFAAGSFAQPVTDALRILGMVLHQQGLTLIGPVPAFIAYPLIPWIGVMALGYVMADLYRSDAAARRRFLLRAGAAAIAGFVVLRLANVYGDPAPWSVQDSTLNTLLSFVNTTKYPPSLLFLLMTLGPSLLILAFSERWKGPLVDFFVTFGRVPLFFYVVHIYLAHALAVALGAAQGFDIAQMLNPFFMLPQGYGFSLPLVYVFWIGVVLALYPASRWFGAVKRRSTKWWMSYF